MRRLLAVLLASLALSPGSVSAEAAGSPADPLRAELDALAAGAASRLAAEELERGREMLRRAEAADSGGNRAAAEAIRSLVPLQIRLVREVVRAAELEEQAARAEVRRLEAEAAARRARDELERVLERLVALGVGRPFE